MSAPLFLVLASPSFFSPSFAFTSHFDSDGAPLSELSWSSSLAVVAVSFSGLFTFIFLMLACLCCKKGDISFKVELWLSGSVWLSSSAAQVSRCGPKECAVCGEMGPGWFGKVLLGEVNSGLGSTQAVVKELRSSASVQDQIHFLEEAQPYRTLQHPALLQCLALCSEETPYLLIMEYCPLGDLKGYLRSCRAADSMTPDPGMTPDPAVLQRMACEISSGLLHLHKHNFVHSDLALRNCLLTSDLTVKIGDYGLAHSHYKDDYFVTPDKLWVPLRWIGPELVDEVHGNLLLVDQTKPSNIWSLGVTMWELFEFGSQPYRHYSDRQVLTYAIKERQLKLSKPLLEIPLSERWYEVMQFCWLLPEQRPDAEEVHLLLTHLCVKGSSAAEDDFEKRWNSLRPAGPPRPLLPPAPPLPPLRARRRYSDRHPDQPRTQLRVPLGSGLPPPLPPRPPAVPECVLCPWGGRPGPGGLPSFTQRPAVQRYVHMEARGLDCPVCDCSPDYLPQPRSYWSADVHKADAYDWDASPALSLAMEPLLGQEPCSPAHAWETGQYVSYKDRDGGHYCETPPTEEEGEESCLRGEESCLMGEESCLLGEESCLMGEGPACWGRSPV
ncbi:hypothetical protein AAFF_G00317480 [Aldrovandia affinis]|uniref:non-specific serine/threonine protein kinase n=1 Tax=Aldrovandia affinis TaxID=143900 RepID=A0AAD7R7F0_9TELE|nr:hypothetical protein AAFF_G00317480 [Aldrovandia affinis]